MPVEPAGEQPIPSQAGLQRTLKKVKPGDPLQIPAAAYNAFVDAARAHQAEMLSVRQGRLRPVSLQSVLVRNDSGTDRDRFDVLGIADSVITPSGNEDEFANRIVFSGVAPDSSHRGKFVVCLEPIASGELGRAHVHGVCVVRVEMASESHVRADIKENDATRLLSAEQGIARLLWVQPPAQRTDPSVAWALAVIADDGGTPPGVPQVVWCVRTGGVNGSATAAPNWVYDIYSMNGPVGPDTLLAQNLSPRWRPTDAGLYTEATLQYGLAFADPSAGWVLLCVLDERMTTGECSAG